MVTSFIKNNLKLNFMKLDWFSVTVTLLFIAIIVGVTISINNKVIEPFTELYFNDFKTLPKITNGKDISFSYTINNLEKTNFTYNVNISAELFYNNNTNTLQLKQQNIDIRKDENFTWNEKISIEKPFEKVKVKVRLENKNQDIHFFSFYAKDTFNYSNYGLVSMDCLPAAVKVNSNKAVIGMHADYGDGWPSALIMLDGNKIGNVTVDSKTSKEYTFDLSLNQGLHVIDIIFDNDKYIKNQTTNEVIGDRNLYIGSLNMGITKLKGAIDKGSNFGAFDCQDFYSGTGIYQNGAYRVRFIA